MTQWIYCPECADPLIPDGESGNPTCPAGHFTRYGTPVAATLAFLRNNDCYLILKRSDEPQKGCWDLPGGFVEANETAYDALVREIREETGITNATHGQFLGTFPSNYGGIENTLAVGYLFDCPSQSVTLSSENNEYAWVPIGEIPSLAFNDCRAALEKLKEVTSKS